MLTAAQLLDDCAHESRIIKFLATKMPEGGLDYRPTEGQRSMFELMRYMTYMAAIPMARAVDGDWVRNEQLVAAAESVTAESFPAAMDAQLEFVRAEMAKLQDHAWDEACAMPWGAPCTLGEYLVHCVLMTYAVYRMQFFLYLKSAGVSELGTMQCWVGVDPQAQG